jgi:hypothetical protein
MGLGYGHGKIPNIKQQKNTMAMGKTQNIKQNKTHKRIRKKNKFLNMISMTVTPLKECNLSIPRVFVLVKHRDVFINDIFGNRFIRHISGLNRSHLRRTIGNFPGKKNWNHKWQILLYSAKA